MDSLPVMFGQPSLSVRHDAIKYIYNSRMKEGTSVREHVLHMMTYFNIVETFQSMKRSKGDEEEVNVISKKSQGGSSLGTKHRPSSSNKIMKKKGKEKTTTNKKGKKKVADKGK